jgi:hypothetical protein
MGVGRFSAIHFLGLEIWLSASVTSNNCTRVATLLQTTNPLQLPKNPSIRIPIYTTPRPTMASTTAQRRLFQEYKALSNNPPEGITAGPVSEDDLLYWEALIQGPEGTPFEGGVFPAELKFPKDYPLAPPSMRFLGEVWHPNGMFNFLDYSSDDEQKGGTWLINE